MAKPLDLEEQEQLDDIKHFWKTYGNLITWGLIVVFGGIAAWNGWQYWQRVQATQASALYDEIERAAQAGDVAKVDRAFSDIRDKYGGTAYAQQAGMLAAKIHIDKGNNDGATAALTWVADKAKDPGYQAVARLRLAAVLMQAKRYDDALKQLAGKLPGEFDGLVADRRGDIYTALGKKAEAKTEYAKAYQSLDERAEYRRLVEVKLNALGVDPKPLVTVAAAATPPVASSAPPAAATSAGAKP